MTENVTIGKEHDGEVERSLQEQQGIEVVDGGCFERQTSVDVDTTKHSDICIFEEIHEGHVSGVGPNASVHRKMPRELRRVDQKMLMKADDTHDQRKASGTTSARSRSIDTVYALFLLSLKDV